MFRPLCPLQSLLFPGRQFAVLRQFMRFGIPASAGIPEDILLRSDARVFIQGAGRNYYVFAAFDVPGKGGAAVFAEAGGKIFAVRQLEPAHQFLSRQPAKLRRRHEDVGSVGTAGEFAAALAVAVLENPEGWIDLVADAAAQTTAFHQSSPVFSHDPAENLSCRLFLQIPESNRPFVVFSVSRTEIYASKSIT